MTLEEFSSIFDIKPSYVKSHWNRIVESKRRQNIEVYKIGRGDSTRYGIRFSWTPEGEVIWDVDALEMMG